MLDPQTLSYAEAARNALGLALRLRRIERAEIRENDLAALEEAAGQMAAPKTERIESEPGSALFATPEGLGVIIHAITESPDLIKTPDEADSLRPIVERMRSLAEQLHKDPNAQIRDDATELRQLFLRIHEIAKEIVAFGTESAPATDLDRALGSI